MDNRHIAPNSNNSPTHSNSINDLEERIGLLNVNSSISNCVPHARVNTANPSLNTSLNDNLYSNMNSRGKFVLYSFILFIIYFIILTDFVFCLANNSTTHRLNPTAQEFVPRSMINSNSASYSSPHLQGNNSQSTNNHNVSNGNVNNIQSTSLLDGENDIEDYIALSYLKDFIFSISNKPCIYDSGISEITTIVNSYLDEDECVLDLIVNQIVDQVRTCFIIIVIYS